ncbi:unnamed protein product [Lepidochelys olivacea]
MLWALQEQVDQLVREQRALWTPLGREFKRDRGGRGPRSTRARRPVVRACYACGRTGHLRLDCPHGTGGRIPHPETGRCPIPQAVRWVREPRWLRVCWACRRRGHLELECPAPRNTAQGNPGRVGPVRDEGKVPRPGAARRRDACWSCRAPGPIKRHCPFRGTEEGPEEVPVGPEGPKLKEATTWIEGTLQEVGTQIVIGPVAEDETQTMWAQRESPRNSGNADPGGRGSGKPRRTGVAGGRRTGPPEGGDPGPGDVLSLGGRREEMREPGGAWRANFGEPRPRGPPSPRGGGFEGGVCVAGWSPALALKG